MTIDEAITHAEEKARELGDCDCAKEHQQLAEWLKELRDIKQNDITMKIKIPTTKTIEVAVADCQIGARYFEDSRLDGAEDDSENPKMPCVETHPGWADRPQLFWCPKIDLNTGQILNWEKGHTARIHYKSVDDNGIIFRDAEGNEVGSYDGYVPRLLDPYKDGDGDYVIMNIDEDGYIDSFKADFSDLELGKVFGEE